MSPEMKSLCVNNTRDSAETEYCFPNLNGSCPRSQTLIIIKGAIYIFMVCTILMTVCGNLLVIISISHFRQLHSPTNLLILSLACIDCCLGSFVMPYSMIRSVESCWYFGETICKMHSSFDMMMSIASILHLCLISVDRYLAICRPLQYQSLVSIQKVACLIFIIWIFSFAFGFSVVFSRVHFVGMEEFIMMNFCAGTCLLILNKEWGVIAALVAFFIPGSVMTSLYLKIFYVARGHAKKINDTLAMTGEVNNCRNHMSEQREKKAAKTLGFVMGVFLLCWLPFFTTIVVDPFINFSTPVSVFDALMWLGYFNSTCNPLIYGFFYPWFQKVFKIIISGQVFHSDSSSLNIYSEKM